MIDLSAEQPVPLAKATKFVPPARQGKRTHLSTLLRWILKGLRSPTGEIVCLEAIRLGGRWVTSREALQRFAERLTPNPEERPKTLRVPASRQKAAKHAENQLKELGI